MILLDLYCGAGGAGKGYVDAGFQVLGVDIAPQPRYPFAFVQMDALEFLDKLLYRKRRGRPIPFLAVHASPPCQAFTNAQKIRCNVHPDLIVPTRERLQELGLPFIIENVPGAPLIDPVMLCGAMFPGLRTYRHRIFEASFELDVPPHPRHVHKQAKMGRPVKDGEWIQVVGNFSGVKLAREAMGIDWMVRDELKEAIPPAYTEYLGGQLWEAIRA